MKLTPKKGSKTHALALEFLVGLRVWGRDTGLLLNTFSSQRVQIQELGPKNHIMFGYSESILVL